MHPELFRIGMFAVKTYGLMLVLAFFAGLWVALHRAPKFGIEKQNVMDTALVIIFSAIVGARLFYVIFHLEEFKGHWLDIINPIQSSGKCGLAGFAMMGGVVLAFISTFIYTQLKDISFLEITDVIAPSFLLGAGITRIGCFFNGCCFGKATCSWIGMQFPENSPAGFIYPNRPVHPTQLYASALGFLMFGALLLIEKKRKGAGFTLGWMVILYSLDRFVIDFFRYYDKSMVVIRFGDFFRLTNNQVILIFMTIGAIILIKFSPRFKQGNKKKQ